MKLSYGGGSGGIYSGSGTNHHGGGGGSSLTAGTNTQATGRNPAGTGHANYTGNVGVGGSGSGAGGNGGNGLAVIQYTSAPTGKVTRVHGTSLAWS